MQHFLSTKFLFVQRIGDELRETSRKLQIQREKQKENARQKHAEESRPYKQDG